jgi:hypothetical protein
MNGVCQVNFFMQDSLSSPIPQEARNASKPLVDRYQPKISGSTKFKKAIICFLAAEEAPEGAEQKSEIRETADPLAGTFPVLSSCHSLLLEASSVCPAGRCFNLAVVACNKRQPTAVIWHQQQQPGGGNKVFLIACCNFAAVIRSSLQWGCLNP